MTELIQIVRRQSRPLEPLPTELESREQRLGQVAAVLFDIYGTLLISASGDIVADRDADRARAFEQALAAVGAGDQVNGARGVVYLTDAIRRAHQQGQEAGIEYPEVDMREIWSETLARMSAEVAWPLAPAASDLETLALHYELRVNPVWPMPHVRECLQRLCHSGLELGLISNAQFLTPVLFPALLGQTLDELGFAADLRFYSFQQRQAKPGRLLFELAAEALARRGILPAEVLFVGNDMLKDILPAHQVGFRTALFAGDARSLRERHGDPRLAAIEPDLVVKDLRKLIWCVEPE